MLPVARTLVISDTHLGRPGRGAGSAVALRPLWEGFDRLIINGDLAEIGDAGCRGQAAREVVALQEMCESDGVEVVLLSGNHDPLITDRKTLSLAGGEVFLTHGDLIHRDISPWGGHGRRLGELRAEARDHVHEDTLEYVRSQYAAANHAAHIQWDEFVTRRHVVNGEQSPRQKVWSPMRRRLHRLVNLPKKAAKVLWYWQTLPASAAAFARFNAPDCRFFIFGHIHRAGVWYFDDRVIINTGAYDLPGRPRAVVIDGGRLSVHAITGGRGGWRLRERAIETFELYARAA